MHITYRPILTVGVLTDFRYILVHIGDDGVSVDHKFGL